MNKLDISLVAALAFAASTVVYADGMHGGGHMMHMMHMGQHAQQTGHQSTSDGQYQQDSYYDEDVIQRVDTEHRDMTSSDGAYGSETMDRSDTSHEMEDETHHMPGGAAMDPH